MSDSFMNDEVSYGNSSPANLWGNHIFEFDLENATRNQENAKSFTFSPEVSDAESIAVETKSTHEEEAEAHLDERDYKDEALEQHDKQREEPNVMSDLEEIGIETLTALMENPEIIDKYVDWRKHQALNFFTACFSAKKRAADEEWTLKDISDLKKDIAKCESEAGKRTTEMVRNSFMLFTRHQVEAHTNKAKKTKENTRQMLLEQYSIDLSNSDFASVFAKEEDLNEKKLTQLAKTLSTANRHKDLASFKYLLEVYRDYLEVSYERDVYADYARFKEQYIANFGHLQPKKRSKGNNVRPRNLTKARHTVALVSKIIGGVICSLKHVEESSTRTL